MDLIGANGIAVLAAAPERVRSRDTMYVYRTDSDFYYLTGFSEPEAIAVLVPGRPQGEFLVFCRERNPERELWDGPRAGPEGAVAAYGADDAFPIADLDDILPGLLERSDRVYYSLGAHEFDQRLLAMIQTLNSKRQSGHAPSELVALDHLLHEMRLVQESRRGRRHASIGAHRGRGAQAGDERLPARAEGVRARGGVPARVSPPWCRVLVSADRGRRSQRLRAALPRQRCRARRRRSRADRCGLRARDVRVGRDADVPGQRPLQRRRSASSTISCSQPITPRRPRPSWATIGTSPTTPPSRSSRAA